MKKLVALLTVGMMAATLMSTAVFADDPISAGAGAGTV